MRHEIADLMASNRQLEAKHKKNVQDLHYQHEETLKNLTHKTDEIITIEKKLEAQIMTVEVRDATILDLKEAIVDSEIKYRRL